MNLPANKSLGQHWLDDQETLDEICSIADVYQDDTVLEIGPGHGSLTEKLLESGAQVIAVELDSNLADKLEKKFSKNNFKLYNQDILEFNLTTLPANYKVVANIPYYLTSNLIRILCESTNPAQSITLLVQKEVAERICAAPGQMSLLSVSAQAYYDCRLGPVVTADKFNPAPKVDSQIVNMLIRSEPLIKKSDTKQFFRVVKAGFSNRRKTLHNSLSAGLGISKTEAAKILDDSGIDPNTRPQELSLRQWKEVFNNT